MSPPDDLLRGCGGFWSARLLVFVVAGDCIAPQQNVVKKINNHKIVWFFCGLKATKLRTNWV
jgi:hypothetical protein